MVLDGRHPRPVQCQRNQQRGPDLQLRYGNLIKFKKSYHIKRGRYFIRINEIPRSKPLFYSVFSYESFNGLKLNNETVIISGSPLLNFFLEVGGVWLKNLLLNPCSVFFFDVDRV